MTAQLDKDFERWVCDPRDFTFEEFLLAPLPSIVELFDGARNMTIQAGTGSTRTIQAALPWYGLNKTWENL